MKKIITLHQNKWVSLLKMVCPEKNVNGYVYTHETRCDGHIVSVLPFRFITVGLSSRIDGKYDQYEREELELLLRHEITPCWDVDRQIVSSITGGVGKELTPDETAVEEIEQEAGYVIETDDLIDLGTCFGVKSSDTIYHLFAVNLTDREKEMDALGDGSELERLAECRWHSEQDICEVEDPLVYANYVRLLKEIIS